MDHFVLNLVSFVQHSDSHYDTKISLANPTYACAMSYLHCTCRTHGCQAETRGSLWRAEAPNLYQMSASDFVSVDLDAETGHSLTDEEIVALVTATDMDDRDKDKDDDSDPHLLSPCLMHLLQFTL